MMNSLKTCEIITFLPFNMFKSRVMKIYQARVCNALKFLLNESYVLKYHYIFNDTDCPWT